MPCRPPTLIKLFPSNHVAVFGLFTNLFFVATMMRTGNKELRFKNSGQGAKDLGQGQGSRVCGWGTRDQGPGTRDQGLSINITFVLLAKMMVAIAAINFLKAPCKTPLKG